MSTHARAGVGWTHNANGAAAPQGPAPGNTIGVVMHPQGNGPDAAMWLSAASLSAAAVRQMTTEVSERALDLDLAAQQLQASISAAISALGAERDS